MKKIIGYFNNDNIDIGQENFIRFSDRKFETIKNLLWVKE